MGRTVRGGMYSIVAASIWGGMYVVSKVILNVVSPWQLVWLRYLVGLAALAILIGIQKASWRIPRRDWALVGALSVVGYVVSIGAQFLGTHWANAAWGSVITASTPALMIVFARPILGEAITPGKVLGMIVAMLGVWVIVGGAPPAGHFLIGGLSLVVASVSWALSSVLVRRISADSSIVVVTFYAIALAEVIVSLWVIPTMQWKALAFTHVGRWAGILYLGAVSTAVAFWLWNRGLQLGNATVSGMAFYAQPIVGSLLGALFLGEPLTIRFLIGSAGIISGGLVVWQMQRLDR